MLSDVGSPNPEARLAVILPEQPDGDEDRAESVLQDDAMSAVARRF